MNDEEIIKETMMLDYSQLVMHNVYMIKENKRLENIIKEVREYIEENNFHCKNQVEQEQYDKELLEILEKENK